MTAMQYQLLPSLGTEEYNALKEDIQRRGVQVPIEFDEKGNVLDGHHRLQICAELGIKDYPSIIRAGMSEDEKTEHVLSLNLNRRHLNAKQRAQLHATLRALGWSLRKIAETTNVAPNTVRSDLSTVQNCTVPEKVTGKDGKKRTSKPKRKPSSFAKNKKEAQQTFDALATIPAESLPDEMMDTKQVKKLAHEQQTEEHRKEAADNISIEMPIGVSLLEGDFREVLANMPDNSVDMIFTDPPYDEESIPLYGVMAEHAARILKPGGSLICYVGHYAIPRILDLMNPRLRFWWICCVKHSGNAARLIGKNVFVEWKPLLWFVKGTRRTDTDFVADLIESDAPDKNEHEWQQGYKEADYYLDHLTMPGETVLDPFAGSGTTLISAFRLNRRAIGIEKDHDHYQVARAHIEAECRQPES